MTVILFHLHKVQYVCQERKSGIYCLHLYETAQIIHLKTWDYPHLVINIF